MVDREHVRPGLARERQERLEGGGHERVVVAVVDADELEQRIDDDQRRASAFGLTAEPGERVDRSRRAEDEDRLGARRPERLEMPAHLGALLFQREVDHRAARRGKAEPRLAPSDAERQDARGRRLPAFRLRREQTKPR